MLKTVKVPAQFEPLFQKAQELVATFFSDRLEDPAHGSIEICGERYILVRAASLSVDFFNTLAGLYEQEGREAADNITRQMLFDIGHALGKQDARNFHRKMHLHDPIEKLSAGPIHFAYAGWAFVDILPESSPSPDENYYLIYDHPYSFESAAWLAAGKRSEFPVCVMNAGYSSGWCEESFGMGLVATEILCQAKGDPCCRFIMAPPSRIEGHIADYLRKEPLLAQRITRYEVPGFFKRKETEEALLSSEQRFRSLFEAPSDGIVLIGRDRKVIMCNQQFARMHGYGSPRELAGVDALDFVAMDERRAAAGDIRQLPAEGTLQKEYLFIRKDGSQFPVEVTASLVRDANGVASGIVGIVRDISERKQAEEKILKQQEVTTQIIEAIPLRVFWKDRDLRYLGCNTLFARDAGLEHPEDLIGKDDFDMGWRDQAELYRADDRRVMDTDTPKLSYDEPQTTPTGEEIWLRTSKVPLHNEVNEVIGILGTYEDITEWKVAEQALEESERKFRAILDSAVDGILVADTRARKFVIANRAICDMLGYPPDELYRLGVKDIHPAEALADVQRQFERQMKGELQVATNLPVKRKDGSVFFADVSSSPLALAGREYVVGVFHDVSERKQAEEKVRTLNEELEDKVRERTQQLLETQEELMRREKLSTLGQVAGSVGHELRNPLGVMSNAVYFLQTVLSEADATTREYLDIIKDEIGNADRIVDDLLDSVRTKPPQPETVVVGTLMDQTLGKITVPAGIEVIMKLPATLPPLRVDPRQVEQIFRNLITNGIDAMPDGGNLEISATEDAAQRTLAISVKDNGIGIPAENLEKLFQPLFTTKSRGIGLGLVVVKNLAQNNGGEVAVESESGKGTTFTVTLPLAAARE